MQNTLRFFRKPVIWDAYAGVGGDRSVAGRIGKGRRTLHPDQNTAWSGRAAAAERRSLCLQVRGAQMLVDSVNPAPEVTV